MDRENRTDEIKRALRGHHNIGRAGIIKAVCWAVIENRLQQHGRTNHR